MNINYFLSKYRKQINFNYNKLSLNFEVSPSLFSAAKIDKGSFQLIDSFRKNKNIDYNKILDVGCGYGPIGIFLKKNYPKSIVHCVDRDSLAVEFTRYNANLNGCKILAYPSLDYENVKEKFSLICCNYPAKAGINVLKKIIYGASKNLTEDGFLAIVIVKELFDDFKDILISGINIIYEKKSSGHFVFHLKFEKEIEFKEEVYNREKIKVKIKNKDYLFQTANNLEEFNNLDYTTNSIIELIEEHKIKSKKIILLNPHQGFLSTYILDSLDPENLILISRDLLSLKYTSKNLENNGFNKFQIINKPLLENEKAELFIFRIKEDYELNYLKKEINNLLETFNQIIISSHNKYLKRIMLFLKSKKSVNIKEENKNAILI